MENLQVLILAAGKGTRMKSRKAKVLHKVAGGALIEHVFRAAQSVASRVLVVVGHQGDRVKVLLPAAEFVDQKQHLGTPERLPRERTSPQALLMAKIARIKKKL